jgi:hypothetical protein
MVIFKTVTFVGFYKDEESGETYIQRLRSNNIHNA